MSGKVIAAVLSTAVPGADNAYNAYDEYMKDKEMTPEQLEQVK